MTTNQDSTSTTGTVESPNSTGSPAGGQPSSIDPLALQKTIDTLTQTVKGLSSEINTMKSGKDRGITKTNKENETLKRQLAELKALEANGVEGDKAIEELNFRETVRSLKDRFDTLEVSTPAPSGNVTSGVDATAKFIEKYKLDANDPEVVAVYTNAQLSAEDKIAELGRVAGKKEARPTPSVSAVPTMQGSAPQRATDKALEAEYRKDIEKARGNRDLGLKIQAEYLEKGLDVHKIVLG